jgi:hypothetical protein
MATMTTTQFLGNLVYRDAESQENASVGIFKDLFAKDFNALLVRNSKTGARRATIMLQRKDDATKVTNIVCSAALTDLVRAGKLGIEEIMLFPCFGGEKGNFVGLPSQGWSELSAITPREYKIALLSPEQLA